MADFVGEKTEAPTPKRRSEARQKGQVAKSQDLPAAVVVLAGLIALRLLGPAIWRGLLAIMRTGLAADEPTTGVVLSTAGAAARSGLLMLVPLLAIVFLAALFAVLGQVGLLFTWQPVTPSLSKLNPLDGIKRLVSAKTLVSLLINLFKLFLMTAVVYLAIRSNDDRILFAMAMDYGRLYQMAGLMLTDIAFRLAAVMVVLAIIDYTYQRYRYEKDLRMSKEEVREEMKHMEGDPLIKRRRREVQMRLSMQRMQQAVPQADVILTNPTHLAIALRYRPDEMGAPKVVAKGADWMAYRIRQLAALHQVPIVERKELARSMYGAVEVGQEIPERFYEAVAEILAFVYELSGRKWGPRPRPVAVA